jgi:hypothetical protein
LDVGRAVLLMVVFLSWINTVRRSSSDLGAGGRWFGLGCFVRVQDQKLLLLLASRGGGDVQVGSNAQPLALPLLVKVKAVRILLVRRFEDSGGGFSRNADGLFRRWCAYTS